MAEVRSKLEKPDSWFDRGTPQYKFPFFTALTFGIVVVQEIILEPDRLYLVDSLEDNTYFVYDRNSVGSSAKTLWKLKFARIPFFESILKQLDVNVSVPGIPSFDEQFGNKGGWVEVGYEIRVKMSIDSSNLGKLKECSNPKHDIQNATLKAARAVLPYISYQDALVANMKENLADWIRGYDEVKKTGLTIDMVDIEMVKGSEKVAQTFQQSFDRILQAKDKSDMALIYSQMDKESVTNYLEMSGQDNAGAVLTARSRVTDQMLRALLASGLNPLQAYQSALQGASPQGKDTLQFKVAEHAFKLMDDKDRKDHIDWPDLNVLATSNHSERLKWEKDVLKERIPIFLIDDPNEKSFMMKLEDDHTLQVIWEDKNTIPQVWIDGKDRKADFAILSSSAWKYDRRTIWDIYQEARRLMNVAQS